MNPVLRLREAVRVLREQLNRKGRALRKNAGDGDARRLVRQRRPRIAEARKPRVVPAVCHAGDCAADVAFDGGHARIIRLFDQSDPRHFPVPGEKEIPLLRAVLRRQIAVHPAPLQFIGPLLRFRVGRHVPDARVVEAEGRERGVPRLIGVPLPLPVPGVALTGAFLCHNEIVRALRVAQLRARDREQVLRVAAGHPDFLQCRLPVRRALLVAHRHRNGAAAGRRLTGGIRDAQHELIAARLFGHIRHLRLILLRRPDRRSVPVDLAGSLKRLRAAGNLRLKRQHVLAREGVLHRCRDGNGERLRRRSDRRGAAFSGSGIRPGNRRNGLFPVSVILRIQLFLLLIRRLFLLLTRLSSAFRILRSGRILLRLFHRLCRNLRLNRVIGGRFGVHRLLRARLAGNCRAAGDQSRAQQKGAEKAEASVLSVTSFSFFF